MKDITGFFVILKMDVPFPGQAQALSFGNVMVCGFGQAFDSHSECGEALKKITEPGQYFVARIPVVMAMEITEPEKKA